MKSFGDLEITLECFITFVSFAYVIDTKHFVEIHWQLHVCTFSQT